MAKFGFIVVLLFVTIGTSLIVPLAANCLDNFVLNSANAGATQLTCCEPSVNKTIPASINLKLPNLELVDLSLCSLVGTIPGGLGALVFLKELVLHQNSLTGQIHLPGDGAFVSLQSLNVHTNYFTGSVSSEFGALTNLVALRLGLNKLTGTLPDEIGQLTHLSFLALHANPGIVSTIPSSFGALTKLSVL
jgi:hypothetical protein